MATYNASTSVPADNGAQAGPTITFSSRPTMSRGDLIIVQLAYRGASSTFSVSNAGGQTWYSLQARSIYATLTSGIYWCIFDGNWSANPAFTVTSGTLAMTGHMHSFSPSADKAWSLSFDISTNSNYSSTDNIAPTTPFTCSTASSLTTGKFTFGCFATDDDNTWGSASNCTLIGYVRNTQGNDTSVAGVYNLSYSGTMSLNQATLGGDPYLSFYLQTNEIESRVSTSCGHPFNL